jgi:hypothetical protein
MIYFIQAGESGPIKIGYTENDIKARVRNIQSSNPTEVKLLGVMQGNQKVEAGLHIQFCDYLIRGEWYQPPEQLLDYIAREGQQPSVSLERTRGYQPALQTACEQPVRSWWDW